MVLKGDKWPPEVSGSGLFPSPHSEHMHARPNPTCMRDEERGPLTTTMVMVHGQPKPGHTLGRLRCRFPWELLTNDSDFVCKRPNPRDDGWNLALDCSHIVCLQSIQCIRFQLNFHPHDVNRMIRRTLHRAPETGCDVHAITTD